MGSVPTGCTGCSSFFFFGGCCHSWIAFFHCIPEDTPRTSMSKEKELPKKCNVQLYFVVGSGHAMCRGQFIDTTFFFRPPPPPRQVFGALPILPTSLLSSHQRTHETLVNSHFWKISSGSVSANWRWVQPRYWSRLFWLARSIESFRQKDSSQTSSVMGG